MKNLIFCGFLILALAGANAQQVPELETYVLKNGLKIYLLKYGKIEALHISVVINSGRKNETPGQQGYNSITANLVLEGNKKYTAQEQNDKAFGHGFDINSSSEMDETIISGSALSKDAEIVFDLISAAIMYPSFDKDRTAQYISSLIDYNNPKKIDISRLAQVFSNLDVYGLDNPLGRSMYKEQLNQVTVEKIREFHLFNYTPKNTKIIVCGNFNSAEIKTLISAYFGNWLSTYGEVNGVALDYPSIKKREISFINRAAATQCALQWNKIAPAIDDKDALAYTIANSLFNVTLFKEIREVGGKTYSIGSNYKTSKFSNLFSVTCSVRNSEVLNTIRLFDKTLQKFSLGGFSRSEFDNEITRFKTNLLAMEYPAQIAGFYDPLKYDFKIRKNVLTQINNLTMEEVQKVIKKYYTPNIYKLVVSGDESQVSEQLKEISNLKKYSVADLELK